MPEGSVWEPNTNPDPDGFPASVRSPGMWKSPLGTLYTSDGRQGGTVGDKGGDPIQGADGQPLPADGIPIEGGGQPGTGQPGTGQPGTGQPGTGGGGPENPFGTPKPWETGGGGENPVITPKPGEMTGETLGWTPNAWGEGEYAPFNQLQMMGGLSPTERGLVPVGEKPNPSDPTGTEWEDLGGFGNGMPNTGQVMPNGGLGDWGDIYGEITNPVGGNFDPNAPAPHPGTPPIPVPGPIDVPIPDRPRTPLEPGPYEPVPKQETGGPIKPPSPLPTHEDPRPKNIHDEVFPGGMQGGGAQTTGMVRGDNIGGGGMGNSKQASPMQQLRDTLGMSDAELNRPENKAVREKFEADKKRLAAGGGNQQEPRMDYSSSQQGGGPAGAAMGGDLLAQWRAKNPGQADPVVNDTPGRSGNPASNQQGGGGGQRSGYVAGNTGTTQGSGGALRGPAIWPSRQNPNQMVGGGGGGNVGGQPQILTGRGGQGGYINPSLVRGGGPVGAGNFGHTNLGNRIVYNTSSGQPGVGLAGYDSDVGRGGLAGLSNQASGGAGSQNTGKPMPQSMGGGMPMQVMPMAPGQQGGLQQLTNAAVSKKAPRRTLNQMYRQ